jgi:hypothetical protein
MKKKRFNAFACLGVIKIVFTCYEIFLQTASGIGKGIEDLGFRMYWTFLEKVDIMNEIIIEYDIEKFIIW